MGLLDRVKQNQTVPPGTVGTANGPAVGTVPGAATYGPATSIPMAPQTAPPAPAAPAAAPSLSQRAGAAATGGDLTPAFTLAKVQIHSSLIEKFADQIYSRNKTVVRDKIRKLAEEYFRSTAITMNWNEKKC